MKNKIVITSIFNPTDAIMEFSKLSDFQLVVVGDKKTPINWYCNNVNFLSISQQEKLPFKLVKVLPYNHYCRKMLGYLMAILEGASNIIDTDDDNIPKKDWSFPSLNGVFNCVQENLEFVNIYQYFTEQKIWPRGLPLNLIGKKYNFESVTIKNECNVGIWQGLADEDPDVDAIYRLTSDVPCNFMQRDPIVLSNGTICPFNTQNTLIRKELFTLMYLPTYVTFRFTDILRGLIAQPIMWLYGFQLGFLNATVMQKRNPHDYMKDFISEIPMYEHCEKIVGIVSSAISKNENMSNNLYNAYNALLKEKIVLESEMITLNAWLEDIESLGSKTF